MHSQIRIQIANRQCQCRMCQTGTVLAPLDADMDRNTAAVGRYDSCCCSCALYAFVYMLAIILQLAARSPPCVPDSISQSAGTAPAACLKLTGVLPACFQVNQVKKPFSGVPHTVFNRLLHLFLYRDLSAV